MRIACGSPPTHFARHDEIGSRRDQLHNAIRLIGSNRGHATPDSCDWSNGRFPGSPYSNACYGSNPSTSYIPMNLRYSAIFCDAAADGFGMTSHW